MKPMGGRTADDHGFATVWVVTAMTVVVAAAAIAIGVGTATVERHRAAAAADAVALKVAMAAIDGPTAACSAGAVIARIDGATLMGCRLLGSIATVEVAIRLPGPLSRLGVATGQARAGPAGDDLPDIARK
jgi:secretion/DNA translocation related TadE-like protein